MLRTLAFSLCFCMAAVIPAAADGEFNKLITGADLARMRAYDETRAAALAEARAGGAAAEDLAVLDALLAKEPLPWPGFDMVGTWQCRTIKVGGNLPLVVYGWFKCRVTDDGSGWMLEKLSGSQRTRGRFYDISNRRLAYLGSGYFPGGPVKPYGSGPATDQFGFAFRTGQKAFRIEFPAPALESKLDIMEFRR